MSDLNPEGLEKAAEAVRTNRWVRFTASDGCTSVAQNGDEGVARATLAELQVLADEFRPTMDRDVLYDWAEETAAKLPTLVAALVAVLDDLDRAEKRAMDNPARMFGGDPFPPIIEARAIRTAITQSLRGPNA